MNGPEEPQNRHEISYYNNNIEACPIAIINQLSSDVFSFFQQILSLLTNNLSLPKNQQLSEVELIGLLECFCHKFSSEKDFEFLLTSNVMGFLWKIISTPDEIAKKSDNNTAIIIPSSSESKVNQ